MPSKTFKSAERVEESDLDTNTKSAQGTSGKSKKTSKTTTGPATKRKAAPANDNASAEKPAKRIKANVSPSINKKSADSKPNPREPTPSSSDSESSSASTAESEEEQTQEIAGGVRKEEATASTSDSSSEEESDEDEEEKGRDGESDEDEDDDDTKSPNEEDSDEDMDDASPAVNGGSGVMFVHAISLSDESTADNGSSSDQVFSTEAELVDNVPPPGFKPLPATAKLSKREAKFLSDKNLAGKQVFFIDTPEGISFEAIKSLKMDDITKGNVVTKQDKKEYSFVEEGASGHLLLTFQEGDEPTFAPVKGVAIKQLTLVEHSMNPRTKGAQEKAAAAVQYAKSKEVRQQPAGLRKRHWAAGFEDDDSDDADNGVSTSSTAKTSTAEPATIKEAHPAATKHKKKKSKTTS